MGAQGLADAPGVHLMTQPAAASRGRIVVVPDGSEKSSLCDVLIHDVLIDRVGTATASPPSVLPKLGSVTTEPSKPGPSLYPELLSKAKALLAEALSIASGDPTRSRAGSARPPKPQNPA